MHHLLRSIFWQYQHVIYTILRYLLENVHGTLDSQLMKYFAQKAPAGRLSGSNDIILYEC